MTYDEAPCTSTLALPVMLLVDADAIASGALAAVLLRRFGSDYRVMTTDSWEAGVSALTELAEHGEAVALVAVDLYLPGVDAVAFLAQARTLHPQAMRALLARMDQRGTRIPFVALEQLRRATALG